MTENNNSKRTERYAEWIYRFRWPVIAGTIVFVALISIGMGFLRLNTSDRVWFNEGSSIVAEYDAFRKRFTQDDALIIAFEHKEGIFNNDTLLMIQDLSDQFWKTKYVTRVDSITNYSHTYVYTDSEGEHLDVKDLIEAKRPTHQEIKALFTEYMGDQNIATGRNSLLIDLLSDRFPYTSKEWAKYLKAVHGPPLTKKEMVDLTAETLLARLPLSRQEFSDFVKRHITKDQDVVKRLMNDFFPTVEEVKGFLLDNGVEGSAKALELAQKIIQKKMGLNRLVSPYLPKKQLDDSFKQRVLMWVFPQISKKQTAEEVVSELRYFLDKLPPRKDELVELISPYVSGGEPSNILVEALQVGFPRHYTREKLYEWLISPNLSKEDLLEMTTEVFLQKLPLPRKEVKRFVQKHLKGNPVEVQDLEPLQDQLDRMLFYTKDELKEKEKIALNEKLVKDRFISADGKTAQILITPKLSDKAQVQGIDFLTRIKSILKKEKTRQAKLGHQYKFHVAGLVEMTAAFNEIMEKDVIMYLIMFLFILLALFILFRSVWGMLIPILVVVLSILVTMGITGFIGYELSMISFMSIQVLLAIGIADSIHLLSVFYRELHHGKTRKESMVISLKMNFLPCLLTSVTTAVGFITLLTSVSPPIRVLGVMVAIGSLFAFVITVTLLPALTSVLPFSRKTTHHKERSLKWTRGLGHFVIGYRKPILISLTAMTLIFAYFITEIKTDNNPMDYISKGNTYRNAMEFIDEKIKGINLMEISIDTKKPDGIKDPEFLKKLSRFQDYLAKEPTFKVTHTNSISDIIKTLNKQLNKNDPDYYKIPNDRKVLAENLFMYTQSVPFGRDLNNQINVDQSAVRLTIRRANTGTSESYRVIQVMKAYLNKNMKDYEVHITGRNTVFTYTDPLILKNMLMGLAIAILAITLILIFTFRSVKIGLLSLIPNVTPLLLFFGLIGLTGTTLDIGMSMVAMVALGIVVDDTIHFMSKYFRAERMGKSIVESVYQVFHDVGSAIIFTSVVLAVGFGIFVFSDFQYSVRFGIAIAFTMVVALVFDLLFLPALLLLKADKSTIKAEKEHAESLYTTD